MMGVNRRRRNSLKVTAVLVAQAKRRRLSRNDRNDEMKHIVVPEHPIVVPQNVPLAIHHVEHVEICRACHVQIRYVQIRSFKS